MNPWTIIGWGILGIVAFLALFFLLTIAIGMIAHRYRLKHDKGYAAACAIEDYADSLRR